MSLKASAETILNNNLAVATQSKIIRSVKQQVFMKMPLLARLLMANRLTWDGGTSIKHPVDYDEIDDLAQTYVPNDALTTGRDTFLDRPWFELRYVQIPIVYDIEEKLMNMSGGSDTQILNFGSYLAKKAMRAMRIKLYKMMYGIGTGTAALASNDAKTTNPAFQSVLQALTHDLDYGHLGRTTTTENQWWQGASIAESYADDATDYGWSVNTFRRAVQAISIYADTPGDLLAVVGDVGHLALKSEVEGRHVYTNPGPLAKYGFNSFMLDGVEIVDDPWLRNTKLANSQKYMYIFNVKDWQLWLHPQRSFRTTPYVHQAMVANGYDQWLARIFLAGNLVCWKPNGSIGLFNLS